MAEYSPLDIRHSSKCTVQSWRDLFRGVNPAGAGTRELVFRAVPHITSAAALLKNTQADPGNTGRFH